MFIFKPQPYLRPAMAFYYSRQILQSISLSIAISRLDPGVWRRLIHFGISRVKPTRRGTRGGRGDHALPPLPLFCIVLIISAPLLLWNQHFNLHGINERFSFNLFIIFMYLQSPYFHK